MCGEYLLSWRSIGAILGSPPRVWGILIVKILEGEGIRITPTCVGNTVDESSKTTAEKDHPHVCGEYEAVRTCGPGATGSPPRVWGIRSPREWGGPLVGITPTCVGNTASCLK